MNLEVFQQDIFKDVHHCSVPPTDVLVALKLVEVV